MATDKTASAPSSSSDDPVPAPGAAPPARAAQAPPPSLPASSPTTSTTTVSSSAQAPPLPFLFARSAHAEVAVAPPPPWAAARLVAAAVDGPVTVRLLGGRTIDVAAARDDTVRTLLVKIAIALELSLDSFKVVHRGRELASGSLDAHGIVPGAGATVDVIPVLLAGPAQRRKPPPPVIDAAVVYDSLKYLTDAQLHQLLSCRQPVTVTTVVGDQVVVVTVMPTAAAAAAAPAAATPAAATPAPAPAGAPFAPTPTGTPTPISRTSSLAAAAAAAAAARTHRRRLRRHRSAARPRSHSCPPLGLHAHALMADRGSGWMATPAPMPMPMRAAAAAYLPPPPAVLPLLATSAMAAHAAALDPLRSKLGRLRDPMRLHQRNRSPQPSGDVADDAGGSMMDVDAVPSPVPTPATALAVTTTAADGRRCTLCQRKLSLVSYPCRCGARYCNAHRLPADHACVYDYKTEGRRDLEEANPVVRSLKL
jgi:hypothetical protein